MSFGGGSSPPPLPAVPPPPAPPPPLGQPVGSSKPGAKGGGPFRTVIGSGEMGIAPGFGMNTAGPGQLGGTSASLGGSSK